MDNIYIRNIIDNMYLKIKFHKQMNICSVRINIEVSLCYQFTNDKQNLILKIEPYQGQNIIIYIYFKSKVSSMKFLIKDNEHSNREKADFCQFNLICTCIKTSHTNTSMSRTRDTKAVVAIKNSSSSWRWTIYHAATICTSSISK